MFDIGFIELLLVLIVGLVVIGPERLPQTIKTCSLWIGRIKRQVQQTRKDFEKEIGADDIRRQLHNEAIMQSLNQSKDSINQVLNDTHQSLDTTTDSSQPSNATDSPSHNNQ